MKVIWENKLGKIIEEDDGKVSAIMDGEDLPSNAVFDIWTCVDIILKEDKEKLDEKTRKWWEETMEKRYEKVVE